MSNDPNRPHRRPHLERGVDLWPGELLERVLVIVPRRTCTVTAALVYAPRMDDPSRRHPVLRITRVWPGKARSFDLSAVEAKRLVPALLEGLALAPPDDTDDTAAGAKGAR